jgi:transcriptional regulator with XRE-family HTH domain
MKHEDIMIERSKRVKEAILQKHYTFEELEKVTGIPRSTLQRYVSGVNDKIPVTFYEAVAAATDTPVDYLLCIEFMIADKEIAPVKQDRSDVIKRINSLPDEKFEKFAAKVEGYLDGLEDQ